MPTNLDVKELVYLSVLDELSYLKIYADSDTRKIRYICRDLIRHLKADEIHYGVKKQSRTFLI